MLANKPPASSPVFLGRRLLLAGEKARRDVGRECEDAQIVDRPNVPIDDLRKCTGDARR